MKKILLIGLSTLIVFLLTGGAVMAEEESSEITAVTVSPPIVSYQTHIENIGWEVEDASQAWKQNGEMSGTSGKGLRLEGIKIKIDNDVNLGIRYQTHIQNIGWEDNSGSGWKKDGDMSGTRGMGYRLEAIQMRLTGEEADSFDLYYQVHAENMGWLGWAKNGESAGTSGYGYRLEGIRIVVVKKGEIPAVGSIDKPESFYENMLAPFAPVIQEYHQAILNGYQGTRLNYVNSILYDPYLKPKTLSYALEDLSGDGNPELIIANANGEIIYDLYWIVDGSPRRIVSTTSFGYRAHGYICENNIIKADGSGGAAYHVYQIYQLNNTTVKTITKIEHEYYSCYLTDDNNYRKLITKEEKDQIYNSYSVKSDLVWTQFN